jgi:hypothetical protein
LNTCAPITILASSFLTSVLTFFIASLRRACGAGGLASKGSILRVCRGFLGFLEVAFVVRGRRRGFPHAAARCRVVPPVSGTIRGINGINANQAEIRTACRSLPRQGRVGAVLRRCPRRLGGRDDPARLDIAGLAVKTAECGGHRVRGPSLTQRGLRQLWPTTFKNQPSRRPTEFSLPTGLKLS